MVWASTGRYVLTMDCDFQHLLPEFRDLFDGVAEGNDVVIGSRFSRHSVLLNYPFAKIFANRAFHALAVVLFGRRIRDVTNNLKIMRREVVLDLQLREPGFAVNAETGLQPMLLGYRVKQVPYLVDQPHARDGNIFLSPPARWRRLLEGARWDCGSSVPLAWDRTGTFAGSAARAR